MTQIKSFQKLENFGRVRLSQHFYMRDFLYSEISNLYGLPNIPDAPKLAVRVGKMLCSELLDPLVNTFGPINIRSSYRSPDVNQKGNEAKHNCARNEANRAGHIWDELDKHDKMGATACIVIPWFAYQYERGRDWRDLAWWLDEHLPHSGIGFHPKLAAFNLSWREDRLGTISSYIEPKGILHRIGHPARESASERKERYADFPTFCGICYPEIPN